MTASARSKDHLEDKILRDAVSDRFPYFSKYEVVDTWATNQATLHRVTLYGATSADKTRPFRNPEKAVIKVFQSVPTGDGIYDLMHSPGVAHPREKSVLELVDNIFSSQGIEMWPELYGAHFGPSPAIGTEDLGNLNLKKAINSAVKGNDPSSLKALHDLFVLGLDAVAKFNGICEAEKPKILSELTGVPINPQGLDRYLWTEHLCRLYFNTHSSARSATGGGYNFNSVQEHIKKAHGIDINVRISEIMALRDDSGMKETGIQHGDCNPLNIVISPDLARETVRNGVDNLGPNSEDPKFVDFVDFGKNYLTRDIASYCILVGVTGVDKNPIAGSRNLNFYRHRHLAISHAWELGDPELAEHVKGLRNGELTKFVNEKVTPGNGRTYANRHFSFFDDAIAKATQLAASFSRYLPIDGKRVGGKKLAPAMLDVNQQLFQTVAETIGMVDYCENPQSVRDTFEATGRLFVDLGLYTPQRGGDKLMNGYISMISGKTAGAGIKSNLPGCVGGNKS
jgi:hypothetical protein